MTTDTTRTRRTARSPRLATKLLALLIALGAAAGLAEAMVRVARPGFPGFRLPQVEHRPAAGLGFEMVPRQDAYTWASPARINSLGFRGPEPGNSPGRPLVLCAGDSMTFGNGVDESDTYTFQLQQLMHGAWPQMRPETFNMGVQRYYTYQEIEVIKRQAPRLRPDAVTLAVYLNDLGVRPTGDFVKEYEDEREQAARAFHNVFPMAYLLVKNSAAIELLKNLYLGWGSPRTIGQRALDGEIRPADERQWRTVEDDLATFRQLADMYGFEPYVVFLPSRRQVRNDMPKSAYPRRFVEYARAHGLVAIDPIDAFKQELRAGRDPYLPWDDHMSATGHRLVAEALLAQLRQHAEWQSDRTASAAGQPAAHQSVH
jgi:lysophospholipase L1-like esterase